MVTTTCLSPASIATARPASARYPREALRTASACCENTPRSVRARNSRRCASASEGQSPGSEYQRFSSWLSPRVEGSAAGQNVDARPLVRLVQQVDHVRAGRLAAADDAGVHR